MGLTEVSETFQSSGKTLEALVHLSLTTYPLGDLEVSVHYCEMEEVQTIFRWLFKSARRGINLNFVLVLV